MSDRSTVHSTFVLERTTRPRRRGCGRRGRTPRRSAVVRPGGAGEADHELDFHVGGLERMTVQSPDGALHIPRALPGHRRGERFIQTYECTGTTPHPVSVATVVLEAVGAGTRLTMTEQGVFLDGLDNPAEREHGTGELLNTLATTREGTGDGMNGERGEGRTHRRRA